MFLLGRAGHVFIVRGGKKIALRGGGGTSPLAPPPPFPAAVPVGGGGCGAGVPYLLCQGRGGSTLTIMAQNDAHVALIILTTHMWGP